MILGYVNGRRVHLGSCLRSVDYSDEYRPRTEHSLNYLRFVDKGHTNQTSSVQNFGAAEISASNP